MLNRRALFRTTTIACLSTIMASGDCRAAAMNAGARSKADVAKTEYGMVKGVRAEGVTTFKGIPYGASTAGAARFQPPKSPQPWSEVRDAAAFGPMCPQLAVKRHQEPLQGRH